MTPSPTCNLSIYIQQIIIIKMIELNVKLFYRLFVSKITVIYLLNTTFFFIKLIYLIKQDIRIFVAYSRPNGWTEWADIFSGHYLEAWECLRLKNVEKILF